MAHKYPLQNLLLVVAGLTFLSACSKSSLIENKQPVSKPNLVIFYVDDLGYGDLSSYGATRVSTPNVDMLANNGIRFTDAHSSSATCTPSRYSLLTGEHAFRRGAKILPGDAAMIIDIAQPTLPKLLKKAGYQNAVLGKWHLGLGDGDLDWNKAVKPGPLEIGFDYSYLIPATGDRVPTVYLQNHHVDNLDPSDPLAVNYKKKIGDRPTGSENPEQARQQSADRFHNNSIVNGIPRIGWMQGGKQAEWVDEDFSEVFTAKADEFISTNKNAPFFVYFSFHDIHVPRLPHKRFVGATDMGPRGDAIAQMDWMTGQVVKSLKDNGVLDNTIIIFTSDNGGIAHDGYHDQAFEKLAGHKPNGVYRGAKYSAYEGGTRVPTIVYYLQKVKPGVSDSLMSQIDIYASIADLLGLELEDNEAIDSQSHLKAWFDAEAQGRNVLIEESVATLSIRNGQWKYIRPSKRRFDKPNDPRRIERGWKKYQQLFDLSIDPTESKNLAKQYPHQVLKMDAMIDDVFQQKMRQPTVSTGMTQGFAVLDSNSDGQVSTKEFLAVEMDYFEHADSNVDNHLNPKEYRSYMAFAKRVVKEQQWLVDGASKLENISYNTSGHRRQTLDLYLPQKTTANETIPLVIWVHGGGWQKGSKLAIGQQLELLKKGFAVASISYRLTRHAAFPAQIHDVKAAVRYLRKNAGQFNLDPDRFGAWGSSAGGHLVSLLALTDQDSLLEGNIGESNVSSQIQAALVWFGPSNMQEMFEYAAIVTPDKVNQKNTPLHKLLGTEAAQNNEMLALSSPITYVSNNAPPIMLMHGDQDKIVPLEQSKQLYKALLDNKVDSQLHIVPGAKHAFLKGVKEHEMLAKFFADKL